MGLTKISPQMTLPLRLPRNSRAWGTLGAGTFYLTYVFITPTTPTVAPAAGATYTHNSVTYTVLRSHTIGSFHVVYAWGSAAPLTYGALTKASGAGDSTISFIESRAPIELEVWMTGGGGGGRGASVNATAGASSGGQNSTFGTFLTATGGAGVGVGLGGNGAGGGVTINAPAIDIGSCNGGSGDYAPMYTQSVAVGGYGGRGGCNQFGDGGPGGHTMNAGGWGGVGWGAAGYGCGGGGGGHGVAGNSYGGGGGGSAGVVRALIPVPDASYSIFIGAGGGGSGGAGSTANSGGNGGQGVIFTHERYQ